MVRLFETVNFYREPFQQVTAAHWQKYPNDISRHVVAVDTLSRIVDPDTGVLRTERLLTTKQALPGLVRRIFNAFCSADSPNSTDVAYAFEVSEVDPRTMECTAYSVNLTFNNLMRVRERLRFARSEDGAGTTMEQAAEVTATGALKRVANYVEDFSIARFASNAALGRQGLQLVLDRVVDETRVALDRLEDHAKDIAGTAGRKLEDLADDFAAAGKARVPVR